MSTDISSLRLSGVITGLDTDTIIQKILDVQRLPITLLENQRTVLGVKSDAITAIKDSLTSLQSVIADLRDTTLFSSKAASSSDEAVATASATSAAINGSYTLNITSVACASTLKSGKSLGDKIADPVGTTDVLENTSYGSTLTSGTFSINGVSISVDATTDTLQDVIDRVNSSGAGVTMSYDDATDKITINGGSNAVLLGSATNSSNFLVRSRLYTGQPSTTQVVSLTGIGTIDTSQAISSAASHIAGGSDIAAESFTINGVSIDVDPENDSLQDILDRITSSDAGVYATYDSVDDRIVLTNKSTGSTYISVQAGSDPNNFAKVLKLDNSSISDPLSELDAGQDTVFYVNGESNPRYSADSVLTETETGIVGVTVAAYDADSTTITVATDTDTILSAVSEFVDQYNSVQNIISSYMTVPGEDTEADDPASILAGDSTAYGLAHELRSSVMSALDSGTIRMLEDIGVTASGDNNLLTFDDESALTTALAEHPDEVIALFTDLMTGLDDVIDAETDATTGALTASLDGIAEEIVRIDDSIAAKEDLIEAEEERLVKAFAAMEAYQSEANSILTLLGSDSSSD